MSATTTVTYRCEICSDEYPSLKAAILCEDRDIQEAKGNPRPTRQVTRPARHWDDD